jgi:bifunctional N-acetylglucosamine-1-phosphate-uridyltransferase/glucosamine-1-phosphate-acetyltransferase GlmU-like protein
MSRILTRADLINFDCNVLNIDPSLWTCIIPAAGKGTRLGYEFPKILYPVLGQTILQHLINLFYELCSNFIVIVSPEGEHRIQRELESCYNLKDFKIVIQDEPIGMAHAVWQAKNIVKTIHTAIVWGDQICLRPNTLSSTFAFHQRDSQNVITFPTVMKKSPYIHIHRDINGKILKVLQKRENEIKIKVGENDCGFFCFSTNSLFYVLKNKLDSLEILGSKTNEINLLQLFPQFEMIEGHVNTLRIAQEDETLGINTVEEALNAELILRNRN